MPFLQTHPVARPALSLVAAIAGTLVLFQGCRPSTLLAPGVSDSTFVAALAALHEITADPDKDSASKVQARDEVLRRYHVTLPQLESAARTLANDPQRAVDVWAAVDRKTADGPPTARQTPTAGTVRKPKTP